VFSTVNRFRVAVLHGRAGGSPFWRFPARAVRGMKDRAEAASLELASGSLLVTLDNLPAMAVRHEN
jgi:hypothetical protein